jgi:hypothetical protein
MTERRTGICAGYSRLTASCGTARVQQGAEGGVLPARGLPGEICTPGPRTECTPWDLSISRPVEWYAHVQFEL